MKVQIGGTATFQDYTATVQARWTDNDKRRTFRIHSGTGVSETFEQAYDALVEEMMRGSAAESAELQPSIVIDAIEDAVKLFFEGDDNGSTDVEQRLYDYLVETRDPRAPTRWSRYRDHNGKFKDEPVSFFQPRHIHHAGGLSAYELSVEPGQVVMYRNAPEIYGDYPSDMDLIVEVLVGADLRLHDLYAVGEVEEVEA